jgi:hypothetical protein
MNMLQIFKKKGNSIITTVFIITIVGSIYFTWHNYRRNHPPYSPEINAVLFMAGDNYSQLEKVLKHYSRNPADSLKLRAAEFLIANMPGKYSVEYDMPFENLMALCMRTDKIRNQYSANVTHGLIEPVVKEDVKYITGDYLINNIELAFKVWEEQPWGEDVPFDVFCEEILPYRIANEPLENWREKILAGFDMLNSSFKTQPDITTVEASTQVNSQLPLFRLLSNKIPSMNYSMLMAAATGMCDEMAALAIFTMRALGIPATKDYTLKWPGGDVGHSWNSVYVPAGNRLSFMGTEAHRYKPEKDIYFYKHKSKIYRQTFTKQKHIKADSSDIPPSLHDRYMKDVTHEYFTLDTFLNDKGGCKVEIPVKYRPTKNTGYAWLATKGSHTWHVIGWGETDTESINFGIIGKNILYMPLYYADNIQTPVHYPFFVDTNDSIHILEADTGNYLQITVTEILPTTFSYVGHLNRGIFEGANRDDFSDAEVLHIIEKFDGTYFYSTKTRKSKPFRYVRYISREYGNCNIAEIELYSDSGEKLGGNSFGSSSRSPETACDKAFDGDIFTFFDASLPNGGWTALDFGEPQTIAEIKYFPRHEGNCIYEGHTYALFCWHDNGWQLYERQVAASYFLNFRIPANGLFYFKNVTTDKTSPWFTLDKNGKWEWLNH